MEISYQITEDDYINFNQYHMEHSPSQKKMYSLLRVALPLIFSIPIYFAGAGIFKQPSSYWLIISIIFTVGWIITFPKQYKRIIKKQGQKLLKEGDNSSFFGAKTMVIEKDNIKVSDAHSSETISKENIKEVKVFEDLIIIYLSAVTAQLVPTRDLAPEIQEELIKSLKRLKVNNPN